MIIPRSDVLNEMADRIVAKGYDSPVQVAIDGIDASGKTTLADELVRPLKARGYSVIRASIDGFHQPKAVRQQRGALSPEGYYYDAFDYDGLKASLLEPLSAAGNRRYCTARFDFRTDSVIPPVWKRADERSVLLFDGVFLQRPEINVYWDLRIWVAVPFKVALERALQRDLELFGSVETITERYHKRYFPAQELYFSLCQPQLKADLMIENSDPSHPSLNRNEL